jgi:hypothetical protein
MAFDPAEYTGRREREQAQADAQAQTAGFDPAAYLGQASPTSVPGEPTPEFGATQAAQIAAPAATTASLNPVTKALPQNVAGPVQPTVQPLGYNTQAIREATEPLRKVVPSTISQYLATPSKLLTDVAVPAMTGIPITPFAGYNLGKAALELPGALGQTMTNVSRMASASDPIGSPVGTGNMYPKTTPSFRQMYNEVNKVDPSMAKSLEQMFKTGSGVNGVNAWLSSNEGQKFMQNPAFKKAADEFSNLSTSRLSQIGRVAAPVARTALRVAGPVGMAMDIADASQFAHEAELGSRLAEGQGRNAQQAFRNMARTQQYGGLTAQEQAILEQDRIDQDIRRKAASRVLGPIAPGM